MTIRVPKKLVMKIPRGWIQRKPGTVIEATDRVWRYGTGPWAPISFCAGEFYEPVGYNRHFTTIHRKR